MLYVNRRASQPSVRPALLWSPRPPLFLLYLPLCSPSLSLSSSPHRRLACVHAFYIRTAVAAALCKPIPIRYLHAIGKPSHLLRDSAAAATIRCFCAANNVDLSRSLVLFLRAVYIYAARENNCTCRCRERERAQIILRHRARPWRIQSAPLHLRGGTARINISYARARAKVLCTLPRWNFYCTESWIRPSEYSDFTCARARARVSFYRGCLEKWERASRAEWEDWCSKLVT